MPLSYILPGGWWEGCRVSDMRVRDVERKSKRERAGGGSVLPVPLGFILFTTRRQTIIIIINVQILAKARFWPCLSGKSP